MFATSFDLCLGGPLLCPAKCSTARFMAVAVADMIANVTCCGLSLSEPYFPGSLHAAQWRCGVL